jgi:hypothetical protein
MNPGPALRRSTNARSRDPAPYLPLKDGQRVRGRLAGRRSGSFTRRFARCPRRGTPKSCTNSTCGFGSWAHRGRELRGPTSSQGGPALCPARCQGPFCRFMMRSPSGARFPSGEAARQAHEVEEDSWFLPASWARAREDLSLAAVGPTALLRETLSPLSLHAAPPDDSTISPRPRIGG